MTLKSRLALAALVCAITAPAAHSGTATPQVRERYSLDGQRIVGETSVALSDLDLSTPAGLRTLLARIETAAEGVCGGGASARGDYARKAYLACRDQAVADAVKRMKSPKLSRLAADSRGWGAGAEP